MKGPKSFQRELPICLEIEGSEDSLHLNVFTKTVSFNLLKKGIMEICCYFFSFQMKVPK